MRLLYAIIISLRRFSCERWVGETDTYILHQIGSIGELKPKINIKRIAVYFSRYSYLHIYNIKDIINTKGLPRFIRWFKKRALEEQKFYQEMLTTR
jgi:hypothetical protein